jgi:hypothetical protein
LIVVAKLGGLEDAGGVDRLCNAHANQVEGVDVLCAYGKCYKCMCGGE